MEEKKEMTREEAWRRLREIKRAKQELIDSVTEDLKAEFKANTGQEATIIEVW